MEQITVKLKAIPGGVEAVVPKNAPAAVLAAVGAAVGVFSALPPEAPALLVCGREATDDWMRKCAALKDLKIRRALASRLVPPGFGKKGRSVFAESLFARLSGLEGADSAVLRLGDDGVVRIARE